MKDQSGSEPNGLRLQAWGQSQLQPSTPGIQQMLAETSGWEPFRIGSELGSILTEYSVVAVLKLKQKMGRCCGNVLK